MSRNLLGGKLDLIPVGTPRANRGSSMVLLLTLGQDSLKIECLVQFGRINTRARITERRSCGESAALISVNVASRILHGG